MIFSFSPSAYFPRPSNDLGDTPRKSRTRGRATLTSRSRNSYIRAPRSVVFAPTGMPVRTLKAAIDFFAFVTTAFCPVMATMSAAAASSAFAFSLASPSPMLMTILSRRGAWCGFRYPRSCTRAGTMALRYRSRSRGGTSPVLRGLVGSAAGAAFAAAPPLPPRGGAPGLPPPVGLAPGALAGAPAGLSPLAMPFSLALVDDLAAAPADARPAVVREDPDADPGRLVALAADQHQVRDVQRRLALDDPALTELLRRALVALHHVDVLDDDARLRRQHEQDLPALALLPPRDDQDGVVLLDRQPTTCHSRLR